MANRSSHESAPCAVAMLIKTVQNLGLITPPRSGEHVVRFEMRRNHPLVLDGLYVSLCVPGGRFVRPGLIV
jgi:hypothetical protein